jgi:hypothetical protein
MYVRSRLAITGLATTILLLAACATAPELEPEPVVDEDPRITAVMALTTARLAEDPAAAPAGLEIAITDVQEVDGQLMFEAAFLLPEARARDAQDFTVYTTCPPTGLEACAGKLASAARSLKTARARGDVGP